MGKIKICWLFKLEYIGISALDSTSLSRILLISANSSVDPITLSSKQWFLHSLIGLNWIWASHESFISISLQNKWEYAGTANEAPGPVGVRSIRVCKGKADPNCGVASRFLCSCQKHKELKSWKRLKATKCCNATVINSLYSIHPKNQLNSSSESYCFRQNMSLSQWQRHGFFQHFALDESL